MKNRCGFMVNARSLSMLGLVVSAFTLNAVVFDFESGDLQGWKVVDGLFEVVVSDREKQHHDNKTYVKGGKWFMSTLETKRGYPDDGQTGVIESPTVHLTGPKITFKIGGGRNQCYLALIDRATGKELARAEFGRLQNLSGIRVANSSKDRRKQREMLNFDRPELSRILEPLKGKPAYIEALNIIKAGKERLKTNPRADMPGFKMCPVDQARNDCYVRRFEEECRVYKAIRSGEKVYDK